MPSKRAQPRVASYATFAERRRLSAVSDKALAVGVGRENVTSHIPAASDVTNAIYFVIRMIFAGVKRAPVPMT